MRYLYQHDNGASDSHMSVLGVVRVIGKRSKVLPGVDEVVGSLVDKKVSNDRGDKRPRGVQDVSCYGDRGSIWKGVGGA